MVARHKYRGEGIGAAMLHLVTDLARTNYRLAANANYKRRVSRTSMGRGGWHIVYKASTKLNNNLYTRLTRIKSRKTKKFTKKI